MTETLLIIGQSKRTEHEPHWLCTKTFRALKMPCKNAEIVESHIFDIGESRSEIVRMALELPQTTHILFLDDDIAIPDPLSLVKMFDALEKFNASIISGLYYNKPAPHWPLIMALGEREGKLVFGFRYAGHYAGGEDPPIDKALKVSVVPAGFLLVKREVFEKLAFPPFIYGEPHLKKRFAGLKGQTPGEDVYFSLKAKEAGYDLLVHCGVRLLHYVPTFVGPKDLVDSYITHVLGRSEQLSGLKEALALSSKTQS